MERRLYFLCGDVASNAAVGALVAMATAGLVGESWPMAVGMALGMLLGDLIALPAAVALSSLFGAMELMLPLMLTGMVAGMAAGMLAAMRPFPSGEAAWVGALSGLAVLAATYALNGYLQARARRAG